MSHILYLLFMTIEKAFLKSQVIQDLKTDLKTDLFVTEGVQALTHEQLPQAAASL